MKDADFLESDPPADFLLAEILGDESVRPIEKPIGVQPATFRRDVPKRAFQNLLKLKAAEAQIGRLPDQGESIHMVVAGDYRTWDLVPAMLSLKQSVPIQELYLATLSYNRDMINELMDLFDIGRIGAVTLITSTYDAASDAERFSHTAAEFASRGLRLLAMRNHCKIILARFADGAHYVSESSGNLRSNTATEQIALTRDAALYAFHRRWMEEAFSA